MARKLTIRRVGGLLPAFSLVVLVLLASLFIWLSTAGLPDWALRRIESEAAHQGIYLSVGQLKLSPASGLAVRARLVKLYASAGDTTPLAEVERATVGISATKLLLGKLQPTKAEFRNLNIALPTDGEAPLVLERASASVAIHNGNFVRLTSASAALQGIPITVRGAFLLPEKQKQETSVHPQQAHPNTTMEGEQPPAPYDIASHLAPLREAAGQVQRAIAAQKWTPQDCPGIEIRLEALRKTQLQARVTVPRYDKGQFHFRDALIDVAYLDNTVLINNIFFRTIEPESEVTLQGGYDIATRQLSFNLESNAALTRMAEHLNLFGIDMEEATLWLQRFRHPDDAPPHIELRGNVVFEENFTLKNISVLAQLQQKDFVFGRTPVNELNLSIFYRDGSFNIDRLHLAFAGGTLTASASASGETGKGKARIEADMDVAQLLGLVSEFTPAPVSLPEGIALTGNLKLETSAELDMPAFIAGAQQLDLFMPTLHQIDLAIGIEKASYEGCELEKPVLGIKLSHLHPKEGELIPHGLDEARLSLRAEAITLPRKDADSGPIKLDKADLTASLHNITPEGEDAAPHIGSASGTLKLGAVSLPDFSAQALELEIIDAREIRPAAENWRSMLQQGSLRLSTGAMHAGDTLLGTLDSRASLLPGGDIDLTLILNRDGHLLHLGLHPRLQDDGMLVLEQVALELPAAGFEPLLALTGVNITQLRLPDTVKLAGNASIDTHNGHLSQAHAELTIPHLVRTPGDNTPAFRGKEIPLSLYLTADARGRADGHVDIRGKLDVTHIADKPARPEDRKLLLDFEVDTASKVTLWGSNTIDVCIVDQLIDNQMAHSIMRDFRTTDATRIRVDIQSVVVDFSSGLTVTASCDANIANIEYQMNALVAEYDAQGKPTGKEPLRTDFGKYPFPFRSIDKARAHVDVLHKEDAAGKVEATRVSITQADLTYDNRPWIKNQGFKKGVRSSRMQGDAIIIDVEEGFVELRNVRGKVYPAYAIGAFYDDLPGFMEDIIFTIPAQVETQHCLFPIYSDCKHPMTGCIRVIADQAQFRFLGTSFPLTSFSGFIWLKDGSVTLDRLNAACWDGAINGAVIIDYSGKRTGFDGYAEVSNINLKPLAAAYDSEQKDALCNGDIRFRTPTPEVKDIQAYGQVHIVNGDLMTLGLFRPVGDLISDLPGNLAELERKALSSKGREPTWIDRKITSFFKGMGDRVGNVGNQVNKVTNKIPFANHFLRYDLQEVHSRFSIGRGILTTHGMKALGYNLNVRMQLEADLDKYTLEGDLWPKISSVPTLILSPITFLSDYMIDIHVFGPMDNILWKFGLNRRKTKNKDDCSVTSEEAEEAVKPRR